MDGSNGSWQGLKECGGHQANFRSALDQDGELTILQRGAYGQPRDHILAGNGLRCILGQHGEKGDPFAGLQERAPFEFGWRGGKACADFGVSESQCDVLDISSIIGPSFSGSRDIPCRAVVFDSDNIDQVHIDAEKCRVAQGFDVGRQE